MMRLWHQHLINYLDDKRLLNQHKDCCALRSTKWGKKNDVVDYVFKYDRAHLYEYHMLVMYEMVRREATLPIPILSGCESYVRWYNRLYRGDKLPKDTLVECGSYAYNTLSDKTIYKEHNDKYLRECLLRLKSKNVKLVNGESIEHMLIELDLREPLRVNSSNHI